MPAPPTQPPKPAPGFDVERLWHVLCYVAGQWYALEYGQLEPEERYYHDAMIRLEDILAKEVIRDAI